MLMTFGSKSQTSFSRNATRAGSEEGRLFSQANLFWLEGISVGHLLRSVKKKKNPHTFGEQKWYYFLWKMPARVHFSVKNDILKGKGWFIILGADPSHLKLC